MSAGISVMPVACDMYTSSSQSISRTYFNTRLAVSRSWSVVTGMWSLCLSEVYHYVCILCSCGRAPLSRMDPLDLFSQKEHSYCSSIPVRSRLRPPPLPEHPVTWEILSIWKSHEIVREFLVSRNKVRGKWLNLSVPWTSRIHPHVSGENCQGWAQLIKNTLRFLAVSWMILVLSQYLVTLLLGASTKCIGQHKQKQILSKEVKRVVIWGL